MRLFSKRRYFIVFYTGNSNDGKGQTIGYASLYRDGYLNKETLIKDIGIISNINNPVLTNIMEITKSDYETWNKKENDDTN